MKRSNESGSVSNLLQRYFLTAIIVGVLIVVFQFSLVDLDDDVLEDNGVGRSLQGLQLSSIDALVDRSHRVEIPDDQRQLTFVHIGKSGGTTISRLLRNGCHQVVFRQKPSPCGENRWEKFPGSAGREETIASKRINLYVHTPAAKWGKLEWAYNHTTSIVMVGRNPLERFVSAFLVSHTVNLDFLRPLDWGETKKEPTHDVSFAGCFPNIEEFALCLDEPKGYNIYHAMVKNNETITLDCAELARDIIMQKEPFVVPHARWGYQSFLDPLPSNTEVFFIRTKFLWEDWINVNNLLGSPHNVTVPSENETKRLNARGEVPITSNLSDEGRKTVCRFLMDDIQVYIDFLNRAINLSDDEVKVTLRDLQESCPEIINS